SYLNNGRPLPDETVNYVASIAPLLGPGTPMSGPLAVYAGGAATYAPRMAARPTSAGCDPDAAYNPDGPCTPLQPAVVQTVAFAPTAPASAPEPAPAPPFASSDCDPDAAYDPSRPCRPLPATPAPVIAQPLPQPTPRRPVEYAMSARPIQESMPQRVSFSPAPPAGRWAIQVGAFANLATAQAAAENARMTLPELLRTAKTELPATTPFGGKVAFRARLAGLSPSAAADACSRLSGHGLPCITVPPSRDAF
ncbi:MAG: SPOR domain-containing protein, partial [Rhodopila sp.]|nr:SPOR domain-containing protein [Rhodopila sp.]